MEKIEGAVGVKKFKLLLIFLAAIFLIGITLLLEDAYFARGKNKALEIAQEVPSIVVPCIQSEGVTCGPPYPIYNATVPTIQLPGDNQTDVYGNKPSGVFVVITDKIVSTKSDGSSGSTYLYGDKITLNKSREVVTATGDGTGDFLLENMGLVYGLFYTNYYSKVFPVDVSAYKNMPLEVKYFVMQKSGIFCGTQNNFTAREVAELLAGNGSINQGVTSNLYVNACVPSFSLPRTAFNSKHAIAYVDLDNNPKTKDNVLVVVQPVGGGNGGSCTGSPFILALDVEGNYYVRDVGLYNVCYVSVAEKGTQIELTKMIPAEDPNQPYKQVKEKYTLSSDSFALHFDNDITKYLVYDEKTETQVHVIDPQNYYYPNNSDY